MSNENGEYMVVEPNAVIGDPVFDVGPFIFGECCWYGDEIAEYEKAEEIIGYLEKSLKIPQQIIRECFYIATVMGCEGSIDRVKFAETVLNKGK